MRSALQDLIQAARRLRRSPGFSLVAILTLALGIGVESAFVTMVNVTTQPPGSERPIDDIFLIERKRPIANKPPYYSAVDAPFDLYKALRSAPRDLISEVSASSSGAFPLVHSGTHAEQLNVTSTTASLPRVFAAPPQAGRWFSDDEDAAARMVAVISDRMWHAWFNANPAIVNQTSLRLLHHTFTVIGVAAPGMSGGDVYVPLGAWKALMPKLPPELEAKAAAYVPQTLIRLRRQPGVPEARITRFVDDATASGGQFRDTSFSPVLVPMTSLQDPLHQTQARVWFLCVVSLVLLGACANLANMFYARGLARETEIAVRLSLGADRIRIARLFLAETILLSGIAAVAGAALASVALRALNAAVPALNSGRPGGNPKLVYQPDFTPDYRVLLIALGAGAFAAALVGITTAWRATRVPQQRVLATAGAAGQTRRDGRLRTGLVAVQITAAVVLVIVVGLFLQNGPNIPNVHLAFDTTHVAAGALQRDIDVNIRDADRNLTSRNVFYDRVLEAARRLPMVEAAALATSLPGARFAGGATLSAEDTRGFANVVPRRINAGYSAVTAGFLRTIDLPLLRGRDIAESDANGEPLVGILSESAARALYPGEDALGKRIVFNRGLVTTVIGIAADPVVAPGDRSVVSPSNFIFVPRAQHDRSDTAYLVFRSSTPGGAIDAVVERVHEIDEDAAILAPTTLAQSLLAEYGPIRSGQIVMMLVGALALGIALLGVYGVITYFVTARTREFGIRLALGATPTRIVKLVVDHAIHIVLIGLLSGVFVACVMTRIVEATVFKTMPNGIATWVVVPILILLTGVGAGFVPARRASRVDPNVSLRDA